MSPDLSEQSVHSRIAVIVPAHDEDQYLGACLASLREASMHPSLAGRAVEIIVVLDHCSDGSLAVARDAGVTCLEVDVCNVGAARDAGARVALARGASWLAFTDADTQVHADWLAAQQAVIAAQACDAICGIVAVDDWSDYSQQVRTKYEAHYQSCDGHRHIHGANFAVSAQAYLRAGGFQPLTCHEDVTLVREIESLGMCVAWSAQPNVRTSSRRAARVTGGFSDFLRSLEAALPVALSPVPESSLPAAGGA